MGLVIAARAVPPNRGDVFLVGLDPTRGSEIQKTRPCLIVSPDELNHHLRTVIIAPLTSGGRAYPWRVPCDFDGRPGSIALDQIRTVDHERLMRHLGEVADETLKHVLEKLAEMFRR